MASDETRDESRSGEPPDEIRKETAPEAPAGDRAGLEAPAQPLAEPRSPAPRRRRLSFLLLALGALAAMYLAAKGPRPQHVRVVLGPAAPEVTAVELQYVTSEGDVARETRFTYSPGEAPRVVAHESELPDGEYRLEIEVDARDGRRALRRQVTLGGGSTQVDVSSALARREKPTESPP